MIVLLPSLAVALAVVAGPACPEAPAAPAAPAAAAQAPARPAAPSALVVEPPEVNFGRVAPGTKHPARFVLRNAGAAPLTIASAKPSCKCTDVSPIEGKTIPPGGTLELTAALQVPKSPGEKDAKVMIAVVGSPGLVLAKMVADVTQPVRAEPAYVDALKGVSAGTVRLSSVDGKPFRVLSAGGKAPELVGFDPAKDAPRAAYELRWSVSAMGAPLPQWWVVDTDRADCAQIPLRIRHETTGARFDPEQGKRFWFPPESVVLAGVAKPGVAVRLSTTIEHLNPAAQGRVTAPDWGKVTALSVPGGEGTAAMVSATPRGTDFVDIEFDFTPAAGRAGALYVPVRVTTPTGSGNVFVAVTVAP
jgi:hypothetical protein